VPTAVTDEDDGELSALISELKAKALEADARGLALYFHELVDEDPEKAIKVMKSALHDLDIRLNGAGVQHVGVEDLVDLAKDHYRMALSGAVYGIPWPWEPLTEDTLGKRPGDFIVFYARMKSLKTWVLLYCAAMDYLNNGCRVLVWSREMSKPKMALRLATILAKVDYQLFKKGLLPPKKAKEAFAILDELKQRRAFDDVKDDARRGTRSMRLLCGRQAPKTLGELRIAIEEFEPDVIYLDSFYHLQTDSTSKLNQRWQRLATLAEEVKQLAEDLALPIIAAHQANREGDKTYGNTLSDVADADAIGREVDLIIRIIKKKAPKELYEEDYEKALEQLLEKDNRLQQLAKTGMPMLRRRLDDEHNPQALINAAREKGGRIKRVGTELALALGGNREGVLEAFTIKAIPGYDFSLLQPSCTVEDLKDWAGGGATGPARPKKNTPFGSEGGFTGKVSFE
jgi:hypothetical protein